MFRHSARGYWLWTIKHNTFHIGIKLHCALVLWYHDKQMNGNWQVEKWDEHVLTLFSNGLIFILLSRFSTFTQPFNFIDLNEWRLSMPFDLTICTQPKMNLNKIIKKMKKITCQKSPENKTKGPTKKRREISE